MNTKYSYWDRIKKGIIYVFLFMLSVSTILAIPYFGFLRGIAFGIVGSISWCLFVLPILILLDYISLRKVFNKYGRFDYNIKQFRELRAKQKFDDVFEHALAAVKKLKGIKNIAIKGQGLIKAKTKMNCKTFGDDIEIKLLHEPTEEILIHIYSKPLVKTTIIDYGKNYENVEIICANLREQLEPIGNQSVSGLDS